MAYTHGVKISEVATSILPPVEVSAGIPFIVGTAPINMSDISNVNRPTLCYSYEEAVKAFGYVSPEADAASGLKRHAFTLSEFIRSQFALFGVAPVILVNVLDPTKHKATAKTTSVTLDAKTGSATIAESGIVVSTIKLGASSGTPYKLGTDYTAEFDADGNVVISAMLNTDGEFKITTGTALTFSADRLDPSAVTEDDIIGGVDVSGAKRGLELVSECFPRFRLVPGILAAPGYSGNPSVAAVLAAKADNINEHFSAISVIDVPTETVKSYSTVAAWKNTNNVTDPKQIACWPMLKLDDVLYNQSTQLCGLMGKVDADNDDVPFVSPSNKNYQMTAAVLADGTEIWISPDMGSYLNGEGIVTALNFIGGWKCWGNRTACYPGSTDVKDAFIPIRRMFSWVGNTLVQTFWQKVDAPLNRRQIDAVVDSANIWLNGLSARQYILGGRVEFLETENSDTDLMDGKARFHVWITPPSPNRELDFVLEYSTEYLSTLFA